MTTDAPSLAPGQLFASRYQIVRRLGEGAFGEVFEARMQPMMRRVALKVLHAEVVGNPQVTARFLREARILGELEHPHVVSVIDVGVAAGAPYLAMELLDGETLGEKIRRDGATPLAEALSLWLPVCAAVQTIHDRGIVHRDLKPENIMLARQATGHLLPKILDFGIAKSETRDGVGTRTNAVMGTPHYMSPEQATDSKNIDGRSDQWALAVILWEMLTGQKLFHGPHQVAILSAVLGAPIPPLGQVMPGAPAGLEWALARALGREPGQRFATVRDFGAALLPLSDGTTQAQWARVFGAPSEAITHPLLPPPVVVERQARPTIAARGSSAALPQTWEMAEGAPVGPGYQPSAPPGTLPPATNTLKESETPRATRRKVVTAVTLLAMTLVAAVGFAVGGSNARTPVPVTTVLETFRVDLRTVPMTARIELDGQAAGVGTLTRDLPRDGRSHTVRVSAAGYETETVSFMDVTPRELVTLRQRVVSAPAPTPVTPGPITRASASQSIVAPVRAAAPASPGRIRGPRPEGRQNARARPRDFATPTAIAPPPAPDTAPVRDCPNGQCMF